MINSFKSRITQTIESLQSHRAQIVQQLKQKQFAQFSQILSSYCDPKSIKTLMSVLQSDFDLKDESIESLFDKIDKMGSQLTKQNPEQKGEQHTNSQLLGEVGKSVDVSGPLLDGENQFLKDTVEYSPQTLEVTPKRPAIPQTNKARITRRMILKQKLKTDSSYRIEPQLEPFERTMTKENQYYSEQRIRDEVYVQGSESHWEELFKIYHKLPLGILKENSFEERSLSYKTVNYEKILAFLTEVGLSLSADNRLQIIRIMRRYSLNHKFVTKSEFKDVYNELCKYFRISQRDVSALIKEKQVQRLQTDVSIIKRRGTSVDRSADNITKRIQIPKIKVKKAINLAPDEKYKVERTYTSNAIQKLKSKELTWEVLFNMSDPSIFTNVAVPPLDLNRANQDEDSYYLQEFYNKKTQKTQVSPTKASASLTRNKIVLPLIRSRQAASKQTQHQQI